MPKPHSSPAPPTTAEELTRISQILHLTHHRNKNQHRLAKWYKSLSQLRRQVSKLLSEVQELDTAVSFSSKKESKYVDAARERAEVRAHFWEERLMERWFVAFSNLVADNQYATLGLLLLGVLARVRSVIRPFGRDVKEDESLIGNESGVVSQLGSGDGNDLGEVVEREEVGASCDMERSSKVAHADHDDEDENVKSKKLKKKKRKSTGAEDASKDMAAKSTPSKRPKKKRKKGDAFDDLFSSLI